MTGPEDKIVSSTETSGQQVAEPPEAAAAAQVDPGTHEAGAAGTPQPVVHPSHHHGETLVQSLLSIVVIVLFVITFIVQAFQIPSESMEKTLLIGDYLLVDKVHFGQGGITRWLMPYSELKRGDIVVFHYPVDPSQHFVKRVIGLPGDHIMLRDKKVFVNDEAIPEKYAVHVTGDSNLYRDNFPSEIDMTGQVAAKWRTELQSRLQNGELVVPPDQYFVMGDNRDHSLDSRYWGFVPRANIVGRPLLIYLSLRERQDTAGDGDNGKLVNSGRLLTHVWQFARWDRMFHLVR
ncbi:MAG TPA: signal peptidase I [Candidatus Angelobacter sp.]